MHYGICSNCGTTGIVEKHHVFFKSKARALKNCSLNFVDLCTDCHRGTYGVHGKHGHRLDIKLKKYKQIELKIVVTNVVQGKGTVFEGLAKELGIAVKEISDSCKNLKSFYSTDNEYIDDLVRVLQGGRLY